MKTVLVRFAFGGFGVAVPVDDGGPVEEILETVVDNVGSVVQGFGEDHEGVFVQYVVLVDEADPFAFGQVQAAVAGIADAAVLFIMEGDNSGITFCQPVHQLAGVVGGGVVAD